VDDARIAKLRSEVLGGLDAARPPAEVAGLEARVAALETAVASLLGPGPRSAGAPAGPRAASHPALQVLGPAGGSGDRCLMEPDKPCVQSHACRVLGH
jgi:hypothetical protein